MSVMATAAPKLDAVALLKADHRKVEDLFAKFEAAKGDGKKKALAEQICMELTVHTKIEEDIFYPACEGKVEEDLLKEAYVEHDGAKVLIAEIEAGGPDDEFYDAKVKVLSEMIEHHVKEEEQRVEGMFSQARKAGLDMDALGEQMAAEKAAVDRQLQGRRRARARDADPRRHDARGPLSGRRGRHPGANLYWLTARLTWQTPTASRTEDVISRDATNAALPHYAASQHSGLDREN
jgi:hemerythrin superfamily protein